MRVMNTDLGMNTPPAIRLAVWHAALILAGLVVVVTGLAVGSGGWGWPDGDVGHIMVWELRLPRSLGAWLAGALLGLAGALGQSLFRNPLADPYLLGSAAGAGLGVALGLLATHGLVGGAPIWLRWGSGGLAFAGAWLALALALWWSRGLTHTPRLLLAGVVVGVVLSAATSALMLAVPQAWAGFQSFMLGTTQAMDLPALAVLALGLLICLAVALRWARVLDVLSLGEATAQSLGLNLGRSRAALLLSMTLATSLAVSHTGLIAFVGLAAPHLVRTLGLTRPSVLPALSAWAGGLLLAMADLISRGWWSPLEWPVGVFTALMGGLYLLYCLRRRESM
ncbi:MAG: hypothetical protein RL657_1410 [Pseudomonadota bacterium]|jgi:iron complex transport system permease protein